MPPTSYITQTLGHPSRKAGQVCRLVFSLSGA